MTRLTQLSIKKFRNVAPTTLEFRPGINVLLGRNAAGKTTLLRLLSTVSGQPDEGLHDDELDVSYRASSEQLDFDHAMTRHRITEPALDLGPNEEREDFSNIQETDSFVFDEGGGVLTKAEVFPNEVRFERAGKRSRVERTFRGGPFASVVIALVNVADPSFFGRLRAKIFPARLESAGRMDESLDRFNDLLKLEINRESVDKGASFHFNWNVRHLPQSMRAKVVGAISERMSATFPLAFLDRVARVLGYASAEARFDVERLNPAPDREITRLSNLRFFFKRPGEEISHERLSYGQKRLLTFFAQADASPSVVIADELVNGLHHEWISACLDEIGERQAFLTSQNPLLLDFLRFESADEVRRTFILCERGSDELGARLIWRNPTVDEAESFFSAYQTGIQRVSDILLTKGLW